MEVEKKPTQPPAQGPRIAIIGAGMSGILCGVKLQQAGISNFAIYEKSEDIGGTWYENKYPGLACDVPSHAYCYSFNLNPHWSQTFSSGPEIWRYFKDTARDFNVEPFIQCGTEISRCEFKQGKWYLYSNDNKIDCADFLIAATGVLHQPNYPDIKGINNFQGVIRHSARWDNKLKLKDKRVGIIGTGSTAIQIVGAITGEVKKLCLFQRTAQWIFPQANLTYSEQDKEIFSTNPDALQSIHKGLLDSFEHGFSAAVIDADSEQMKVIETTCMSNLENSVRDSELRAKLTPDYRAACKRLIMSDNFYQAIQQPNAELITTGIEQIEPTGVLTQDGQLHELDIIILATGFKAHQFMRPMALIGRDGQTLEKSWQQSTQAYRSVSIPDFPNFFMLIGPNSPVGNFSLIDVAEMQLDYILKLISHVQEGRASRIEASKSATEKFNRDLADATKDTIWVTGCRSWYLDSNGIPATWPWSIARFREEMKKPDLEDFVVS